MVSRPSTLNRDIVSAFPISKPWQLEGTGFIVELHSEVANLPSRDASHVGRFSLRTSSILLYCGYNL